ncbi:MAG TPA: cytochrome c [Labilithrix sp.]
MKIVLILFFVACALVACGGSANQTATDSAAPEERGKEIVAERACASCHSADLAGADTPRPGTRVFPANLTPDADTGIGTWSDADVARAIRTGVDDEGASLCSAMPRFGDLSDEDAAAIVAYLRALPAVRHEVPASRCGGAT